MFKPGSKTHSLLMVAKMLRKPFNEKDVTYILAIFDGAAKVRRSARVLVDLGYLKDNLDGTWTITPSGVEAVYANALKSENRDRT